MLITEDGRGTRLYTKGYTVVSMCTGWETCPRAERYGGERGDLCLEVSSVEQANHRAKGIGSTWEDPEPEDRGGGTAGSLVSLTRGL